MRALSSAKDTLLLTWERWAQPLDQVHGEEEMVFTDKQSLKNSLLKGRERGKGGTNTSNCLIIKITWVVG